MMAVKIPRARPRIDPAFAALLKEAGLPMPRLEYQFAPPRKWRFDYAWYFLRRNWVKVALEVQGGIWTRGRHVRGKGYLDDIEKHNAAIALGWQLYYCTPDTLATEATIELLKGALT